MARKLLLLIGFTWLAAAGDAPPKPKPTRGDALLTDYFRIEVRKLEDECLSNIHSLEDWNAKREQYRLQLLDMLGLSPLPERTDLKPVVTGKLDHEKFTVEKVHFQSRPGLYVTGSLYIPKGLTKPAPAILYLCGHSRVLKNGILYGSKTNYQHHPAWYASNGYVALIIDMFWFSEIEGLHHGTFAQNMWWWNSRGYTPAGVETWNAIRALDYLETRSEVDKTRFGVTGRSGGGAYSWYLTALDERIKAAVPVAGITDLQNHVLDNCVEGHCDCMFMVNTYRWDYPLLAALAAPRPLLLSNSDKDGIFPLEGVQRTHEKLRAIYKLHNAVDKLGLLITEGPHKDTPDLQVPSFRWFNRFLKNEDTPIEPAKKYFEPEQLKVFAELPKDEINTKAHEQFVAMAEPPAVPQNSSIWIVQRHHWLEQLLSKSFRGWPAENEPLEITKAFAAKDQGLRLSAYDFSSQDGVRLRLFVLQKENKPARIELMVLDHADWPFVHALASAFGEEAGAHTNAPENAAAFERMKERVDNESTALAFIAPRAVGPTAWSGTPQQLIHKRRRFMLLGQTLAGMQVWDVRRALQTVREVKDLRDARVSLSGNGYMAGVALYASLFEPRIDELMLRHLPVTHMDAAAPDFLNVLRFMDMPQTVALAVERSHVRLSGAKAEDWKFPLAVKAKFNWQQRLEIEP